MESPSADLFSSPNCPGSSTSSTSSGQTDCYLTGTDSQMVRVGQTVPVSHTSTQTDQQLLYQLLLHTSASHQPEDLVQPPLHHSVQPPVQPASSPRDQHLTHKHSDLTLAANPPPSYSQIKNGFISSTVPDCAATKSKTMSGKSKKSGLSCYLVALRPWSLPASLIPVALGSCLAYKSEDVFSLPVFLTTALTALCVHAAGNLVNTYCDFYRGIDTKKSDDRTLVDSILTPNDVARLGGALYILGCFGLALVYFLSPAKIEQLALIYFCGMSSSFLYTGGLGLKYIAMGDILIVLTFGPLSVVFSYLSQTGQLSVAAPLLYAVPMALNTEAILHCNNTRDMDGDKQAGAITLAILLGRTGSYVLFTFLLFTPYILFIVIGVHFSRWILLPAASIFIAFPIEKQFRRGQLAVLPQQVAQLNLVMGVLYILSLYMSDWTRLPNTTF